MALMVILVLDAQTEDGSVGDYAERLSRQLAR